MIEAERRRLDAFAVRGTEEDRIRELEERLQRLRLADRFATFRVASDLPRPMPVPIVHAARAPRVGPTARRDGRRWRAVRALWARLVR